MNMEKLKKIFENLFFIILMFWAASGAILITTIAMKLLIHFAHIIK
jgi:hypothetical protein